jgi:hypothetical protein
MVGWAEVLIRRLGIFIMEQPAENQPPGLSDPIRRRVIVQCREASYLGYMDTDGKWKCVYTKQELLDVIDVNPIGDW